MNAVLVLSAGLAILCLFVLAGSALAYALGAATTFGFLSTGNASYLRLVPQRIFAGLDVFAFMAMPLFILAGEVMERAGITRVLVDAAATVLGRVRGALGYVTVATAVFLSGVSGSGLADAAALSSTLVPEMVRRGYSKEYAGALTVAASVVGPVIPPSIVMVIYGGILNVSVPALFAAGIVPGLMLAAGLAVSHWLFTARRHADNVYEPDAPPLLPSVRRAAPALLLPIVVVGGIVFGIMTPTEAAAVTVLTSVLLGAYYRELTIRRAFESLTAAVVTSGSVFLLLAVSSCVTLLMVVTHASDAALALVHAAGLSGLAYLLLAALAVFLISVLVDNMIALTVIVPLLVPKALADGGDPVHVGVVVCLVLSLAIAAPPLGGSLLVVSTVTRANYASLCRAVIPFLIVETILIIVVIVVPGVSLALPRWLGIRY